MNARQSPRLYMSGSLSHAGMVIAEVDRAHYLQNVMRLSEGDNVRLFNGIDGEWSAIISKISKRSLDLTLERQLRTVSHEQDLWLCSSPIKKSHFEYMIEKATELGVAVIQPVLTDRTQVRDVNIDRMRVIAVEAAEQSERLSVPECEATLTLASLLKEWNPDRSLIVCAEWGEALPIREALVGVESSKAAILIGPEGGFTADEFTLLRSFSHAQFVSLGPRILRADTAALAALSVWQAIQGDWTIPRALES